MSIWTFNRARIGAAVIAVSFLGGCLSDGAQVGRAVSGAPTAISVADHAVVISAPEGFCIDKTASRPGGTNPFVLMASCQAVTGNRDVLAPTTPAVLTATVEADTGGAPPPRPDTIKRFLATDSGRAILSLEGDPSRVNIEQSFVRGDAVFVEARESGVAKPLGGHSWRVIFPVNGRIVSATVRDLDGQAISTERGFQTLDSFARNIRQASNNSDVSRSAFTPGRLTADLPE